MNKYSQNVIRFLILLTLTTLIDTNVYSQVGTSVSYSVDNALGLNLFYTDNLNSYYLGYSYQFNGQKNKVVDERKSNYGTTPTGDGDFYWLIDFGYSRLFFNSLSVQPEFSVGSRRYFRNYKDDRFTDGGYSLVSSAEMLAGVGVNVGYVIDDLIEPYLGFHTIKKLTFGVRIHFNFYN